MRQTTWMLDDSDAVRSFLYEHHLFAPQEAIDIAILTGGVSSMVVRAQSAQRCLVVKQALPQLKVRDEWLSRVERSSIEARCAEVLERLVPGSVPTLLAVDDRRHAFAMECAPEGSLTWKALLMAGTIVPETAVAAGELLGRIHARSAEQPSLGHQFEDQSFFQELRVDPYLRTVERRHPDLAGPIQHLIEDLLGTRVCLVHGDYSPKNVLVSPDGKILLVDHEVAHWGNPTFDVAFALNHLCLKALKFPERSSAYLDSARRFCAAYALETPPRCRATMQQAARLLGGLLLARVDGKSPVEYLETEEERNRVRSLARELLRENPDEMTRVFERVATTAAHA